MRIGPERRVRDLQHDPEDVLVREEVPVREVEPLPVHEAQEPQEIEEERVAPQAGEEPISIGIGDDGLDPNETEAPSIRVSPLVLSRAAALPVTIRTLPFWCPAALGVNVNRNATSAT